MPERRIAIEARDRIGVLEQRYRRTSRRLTMGWAINAATLVVVSIVLVGLVGNNSNQNRQLKTIFLNQTRARAINTEIVCDAIGDNAAAVRAQSRFLGRMIVDGTRRQGRRGERIYRAAGQPPYRQRLRQARKVAKQLRDLEPATLDCAALARRIR